MPSFPSRPRAPPPVTSPWLSPWLQLVATWLYADTVKTETMGAFINSTRVAGMGWLDNSETTRVYERLVISLGVVISLLRHATPKTITPVYMYVSCKVDRKPQTVWRELALQCRPNTRAPILLGISYKILSLSRVLYINSYNKKHTLLMCHFYFKKAKSILCYLLTYMQRNVCVCVAKLKKYT